MNSPLSASLSTWPAVLAPASSRETPDAQIEQGLKPDFQYWHDLFAKARGASPEAGPSVQSRPPLQDVDALARQPGRHTGDEPSFQSCSKVIDAGNPGHGNDATGLMNASDAHRLGAQADQVVARITPDRMAAWGHDQAGARNAELGNQDELCATASPSSDQAWHGGAATEPADSTTALQAHIVKTADGAWKVALRARHSLSVSQALAAVAHAIEQDGTAGEHIGQVILNGACIYQNAMGTEAPRHPATAPLFELKC